MGPENQQNDQLAALRDRAAIVLAFAAPLTFILVYACFGFQDKSEREARTFVLDRLRAASPVVQVRVNGRDVDDDAVILAALKTLASMPAHHSSQGDPIRIRIMDRKVVTEVNIARDSVRPDEYWVYRPGRNMHNDRRGAVAGAVTDPRLTAALVRIGL